MVAPTSAYRMDPYAILLFDHGVKAAIGKGNRGLAIRESCKKNTTVCFSAIGGISATLQSCIRSATVVAYEDLKAEAVQRLEIENFPLLVTNDAYGRDLFEEQVAIFEKQLNPATYLLKVLSLLTNLFDKQLHVDGDIAEFDRSCLRAQGVCFAVHLLG